MLRHFFEIRCLRYRPTTDDTWAREENSFMRLSPSILRALYPLVLLGIAFNAGCSSDDRTPERPGGRAGTLKVYTATYDDGRAESQFFLKAGDAETRLIFDVDPVVDP